MAGYHKEFTFKEWNDRANRFANGLQALGVGFQRQFCSYFLQSWGMDGYLCRLCKGGQVVVPIMFRLAGPEIEYIVNHRNAKALSLKRLLST